MTDINHVVLVGHLTRDLGEDERSFGYVGNGQARANISIAVNRSKKTGDQWIEEANYFDVTIWGNQAVSLKPYLKKGKQIAVDGYLKQDRWEKDGQKMSKVSIVANSVQLLGGNSSNGGNGGDNYQGNGGAPRFQALNNQNNSYSDSYNQDSYGDTSCDFREDIPF